MNYTIDVDGYANRNNLIRRTVTNVSGCSFTQLINDGTVLSK